MRISDWSSDVCSSDLTGAREVLAQVRIEIAGGDLPCPGQIAGERKGRIPARSDLEAPHPREVDARVAKMPGHDRPVVHLHRQFALEAPQATEPALQVEVQHRTAGDGAKHLLDDPFDSPVHRCFRTRSEEHTSELQSLMRISYAVF